MLDIEELYDLGARENVCSFYHSRYSAEEAHLVLMPYNYLFDHRMRKSLKIEWNNAVVVFDEAHNLEDSACEAMSRELASSDFASMIDEMKTVLSAVAVSRGKMGTEYTAYVHHKWRCRKRRQSKKISSLFNLERKIDGTGCKMMGLALPRPACSATGGCWTPWRRWDCKSITQTTSCTPSRTPTR